MFKVLTCEQCNVNKISALYKKQVTRFAMSALCDLKGACYSFERKNIQIQKMY